MNSIKEFTGSQLKDITVSSKNCVFIESGWKITDRGMITFDFGSFSFNEIEIFFKRISGDGNLNIVSGENKYNIQIVSKISQSLLIKNKHYLINMSRPNASNGEIVILGFKVHLDVNMSEDNILKNWKNLIKQCGKYSYLTLVNNRLFAASGAFIENGFSISNIETSPSNMFKLDNGKLIFLGACEIINFDVTTETSTTNTAHNLFDHRTQPTQSLPPNPIASINTIKKELFIYDSKDSKEFSRNGFSDPKLIKFIKSNGQDFILIKRLGVFSISASWIEPNTEYTIAISGKRLNGNGKIQIGFTHAKQSITLGAQIFMDSDTTIVLNSGSAPMLGENYQLAIRMPEHGTGEILISRIQISISSEVESGDSSDVESEGSSELIPQFSSSLTIELNNNGNKKFVIVIPSYNNVKWCENNINSVINQNYNNYRVIYTDDNSSDGTFDKITNLVQASVKTDKFTLIKNTIRKGALENLYNMIHSCEDDEIVLTLDGDDWLSSNDVLNKLNNIYSSNDVWMTYGQYQNYPDKGTGIAQPIPNKIINSNSFREYTWCASHLRTFYSWLFKNISKKSLMYKNTFMSMTWDLAMMFPMLEMASTHSKFIQDILYIYNLDNPINDHKVNKTLQQNLDRYVRTLPKYQKLDRPLKKKLSVGLLLIATGKYQKFLQGLISSADKYFLNTCDVTYYVFSDTKNEIISKRPIVDIDIEHKPFPFASMNRFKYFIDNANKFVKEDYVYYVDVDCLFVDKVGEEIIGDLVSVQHCGFFNTEGPFENNPKSEFFVPDVKGKQYMGGGFSGGLKNKYLELARWCNQMIEKDLSNDVMPRFHDETAINKYFLENKPNVILSPSYHYPESNLNHYKKIWGNHKFSPKIMLLDKNHYEIRN